MNRSQTFLDTFMEYWIHKNQVDIQFDRFSPHVLFFGMSKKDEPCVMPMPNSHLFFQNERGKDLLPGGIAAVYEILEQELFHDLLAVVAVSDAYMSSYNYDSLSDEDKRLAAEGKKPKAVQWPKQDPQHIEGIMVAINYTDRNEVFFYEYHRKENEITFDAPRPMNMEGVTGRMINLFPPNAIASAGT